MKAKLKRKLISFVVLTIAVVGLVEFQKYTKRQAEQCVNGVCAIPSELAGTVVGPQSVPFSLLVSDKSEKPLPRLIDFGAGSCATCKMMNLILEDLASEYNGRLIIQLIDTSENKTKAEQYKIRMIPTQIFLDAEGNELFRHEGFISKEDILAQWVELGVEL
jgi:thioredoxin 1